MLSLSEEGGHAQQIWPRDRAAADKGSKMEATLSAVTLFLWL